MRQLHDSHISVIVAWLNLDDIAAASGARSGVQRAPAFAGSDKEGSSALLGMGGERQSQRQSQARATPRDPV